MMTDPDALKEPDEDEAAPLGEEDAASEDTFDIHLRSDFVQEVIAAAHEENAAAVEELVEGLHDADLADLFSVVDAVDRRQLASLLQDNLSAEFFSELDGAAREDVFSVLDTGRIADVISELETDDAVYLIGELASDDQQAVLRSLTADERAAIEEGLSYPEDSAGRLMQRDLIAIPLFWTVGQTIDYLRNEADETLPSAYYEIVLVDPAHHPVGTVALSKVIGSPRKTPVEDLMNPSPRLIEVSADQEDVAYQFQKYHLIQAAVVDGGGRLVGIITVDDIVEVIGDEAQEDILALAGVQDSDINNRVVDIAKTRALWLLVNLGTAVLASLVIGLFDATLDQMVALAILMPIVASMGGNAGTQTMTVAVRAIATRELSSTNMLRVVNKELLVSLLNGAMLGVVIGGVTVLWFGNVMLGSVLAVSMVFNMICAALSGVLIPMALDKLKIDPAVASSVFVTTITDIVGFVAFLGLAALWLL